MRKVIGGLFQSLDGVIQAPGSPTEDPGNGFACGGWAAGYSDETVDGFLGEQIGGANYDLLLGRRTYDIFAAYWPLRDDHPVGERFNRIAKYVVTSRPETLEWSGSHALVGDPAQTVAALRHAIGPDLLIQGSGQLYPSLLAAGLVDRLYLITMPIILGQGRRALTNEIARPSSYRLTDHRVSATGVVMTVFEPDGDVRTGDFTPEDDA